MGAAESPLTIRATMPRDELLFRLGLMSIPCNQQLRAHAVLATLVVGGPPCEASIDTKTQQCPVAVCSSTSGTACVGMGGGVSYAEVVP